MLNCRNGRVIMFEGKKEYLQPSALCDFDRSPDIGKMARRLIVDCRTNDEKFRRIFSYVKELPYGLDDWDIAASETLKKGWGMCSGKTNLLVAMLRCAGIPSRYRIYAIRSEPKFWEKVREFGIPEPAVDYRPIEQDHVDCEVWLGGWLACDPARDGALERGLLKLGIPLERQAVVDVRVNVPYLRLASFDEWAGERQERRKFREGRGETFSGINEIFQRIREIGGSTSGPI